MNSHNSYREKRRLHINVYLLFYIYVFTLLVLANLLPHWQYNYFFFFTLGIAGVSLLILNFKYCISITENDIVLSILVPFKVTLLKLKTEQIKSSEKTTFDANAFPGILTKMRKGIYLFGKKDGVNLLLRNGKMITISGVDVDRIISIIHSFKSNKM